MTNNKFKKLNTVSGEKKSPRSKTIGTAAAVTATFAISLTVTFSSLAATMYQVGVAGNESKTTLKSFKQNAESIVSDVGLDVKNDDILSVTSIDGGLNSAITVYKSGVACLSVDGQRIYAVTAGTVADTLKQCGIEISDYDYLSCSPDDLVYDGMQIEVIHAFDVFIDDNGTVYTYTTTGGKVGEAIKASGIVLSDEDEVDCLFEDYLTDGMTIKVLRCEYKERTAEEEYEYDTVEEKDDSLYVGQTKITKNGKNGTVERVYREKYLGGALVDSEVVSETIVTDAVNAVKSVGTKKLHINKNKGSVSKLTLPSSLSLDENGLPENYSSYIDGMGTAYTGGGLTASGRNAAVGYVAVDPKVIPYGTELYIVSLDGQYVYGYCIAADTGGFVDGGWANVDLYMDTESECWTFGIRGVRIYIL